MNILIIEFLYTHLSIVEKYVIPTLYLLILSTISGHIVWEVQDGIEMG